MLAGRYTLLEQSALDSFLPLCETRGIGVVIGGPYNSGILTTGAKRGAFYDYSPAIEKVVRRHKVKLVEAALRFPLFHPSVVSVIPGASRPAEVALNMRTLAKRIPEDLWSDLKSSGLLHADAPTSS